MRNIKRFLALALSVMMLIGCCSFIVSADDAATTTDTTTDATTTTTTEDAAATAAEADTSAAKSENVSVISSAAFADVEEYNDAINILSALNVIKGKDQYTFAPDEAVSRSQMAIFLARSTSGWCYADNADDIATWKKDYTNSTFTDIVAGDYLGAIDYCFGFGYINGRSATSYDPNATVTFQEALTMCIRALGYDNDSMQKGYPWTYIEKATSLDLDDELEDVSYTASLTRAQTAQLIYNFLFTPRLNPDYKDGVALVVSDVTVINNSFSLNKYLPSFAAAKHNYVEATFVIDRTVFDGNKTYVYAYLLDDNSAYADRDVVYKFDYDTIQNLLCDDDPAATVAGTKVPFDYVEFTGRSFKFGMIDDTYDDDDDFDEDTHDILYPILANECGNNTIYQDAYAYNVAGVDYSDTNIVPGYTKNDVLSTLKLKNLDGTYTTYNIVAENDANTELSYNQILVYDSAEPVRNMIDTENRMTYGELDLNDGGDYGTIIEKMDYVYKAACFDEDDDGYYDRVILYFSDVSSANKADDNSGEYIRNYYNDYEIAMDREATDSFVLSEDFIDRTNDINKTNKIRYYIDVAIPAVVIIDGYKYNDASKYVYSYDSIDSYLTDTTKVTGKLVGFDMDKMTMTVKIAKVDKTDYTGTNNVLFRLANITDANGNIDNDILENFLIDNLGDSITFTFDTSFPNAGVKFDDMTSSTIGEPDYYIVGKMTTSKLTLIGIDSESGLIISTTTIKPDNMKYTSSADYYDEDEDTYFTLGTGDFVYTSSNVDNNYLAIGDMVELNTYYEATKASDGKFSYDEDEDEVTLVEKVGVQTGELVDYDADGTIDGDVTTRTPDLPEIDIPDFYSEFASLDELLNSANVKTNAHIIEATSDDELEIRSASDKVLDTYDYNANTKIIIDNNDDTLIIKSFADGVKIDATERDAAYIKYVVSKDEVKFIYVYTDGKQSQIISSTSDAKKFVDEIYFITDDSSYTYDSDTAEFVYDNVFRLSTGEYDDGVAFSSKYYAGTIIGRYSTDDVLSDVIFFNADKSYSKYKGGNAEITDLTNDTIKVEDLYDDDIYANIEDLDGIYLYTVDDSEDIDDTITVDKKVSLDNEIVKNSDGDYTLFAVYNEDTNIYALAYLPVNW